MRPHVREPEVVVVGGGPAGCAAATLLARWGHSVTLFARPHPDTLPLGESIPPSTQKLFDILGVRDRLDEAGAVRSTGNTVWWGSATPRIEFFADGGRGWQVTTTQVERVFADLAHAAGADLRVQRLEPDAAALQDAAFVLDCTGRTGLLARSRHLRVHEHARRSVAMVGLWSADRFDVDEPTHTLVESYEGGWAWSVPATREQTKHAGGEERFVAVMVDPRVSDLVRESESRDIYLAELGKAPAMQRVLRSASLREGPRGWDASMYHASRYTDDNVLLVGDAASFIDPLSSAGVKKALASAWLAAVATHTSLIRPEMQNVALDFFASREREVYATFRDMTDGYWRDAASSHSHPFWTDRAVQVPDSDRTAVVAAFERLRSAPALCVRSNAKTMARTRAAVSGTEIVLEERLVRDESDPGVRYLYDVDVLTLASMAPHFVSVPALFEAYNTRNAPVNLPDFLAALATSIAEQWLVWCDTT